MKIKMHGLGLIGLMGGLGGAINAWMCYLTPFPSFGSIGVYNYRPIILGGAAHGALLAVMAVILAKHIEGDSPLTQLIVLVIGGWCAGWISGIPIGLSSLIPSDLTGKSLMSPFAFVWPLFVIWNGQALWLPFYFFGLVALLYAFFLSREIVKKQLGVHLLIGVLSGTLGSLWFWAFRMWYFSLIHGTIWGSLVGFGVWKSQQVVRST